MFTQRCEPRKGLALELTDTFTRQIKLMADRLECPRLTLEPKAELKDAALALWQRVQRSADVLAPQRLLGLIERIRGFPVCEEVTELAFIVGADGLIERN